MCQFVRQTPQKAATTFVFFKWRLACALLVSLQSTRRYATKVCLFCPNSYRERCWAAVGRRWLLHVVCGAVGTTSWCSCTALQPLTLHQPRRTPHVLCAWPFSLLSLPKCGACCTEFLSVRHLCLGVLHAAVSLDELPLQRLQWLQHMLLPRLQPQQRQVLLGSCSSLSS